MDTLLSGAHVTLLVSALKDRGFVDDVLWPETVTFPRDADAFALVLVYVICHSGMRFAIADRIFARVRESLLTELPLAGAFGHKGKVAAISRIWSEREALFVSYQEAPDKLGFLAALPWIGDVTKFHAAKMLGHDCVKPDLHLTRLSAALNSTPDSLCERLARETGYRIATIDSILWRSSAIGLLDSRTACLMVSVAHGSEPLERAAVLAGSPCRVDVEDV